MSEQPGITARAGAWFDRHAPKLGVRIAVAIVLAMLHVGAFMRASTQRINMPFKATADEPYYSNPDAFATIGYPRQPHFWSRLAVSRWDSQHYIGFALRGITACPTDGAPGMETDIKYLQCGLGWLPAWGLVAGVVHDTTGMAADISLFMLSLLAAILVNLLWTSGTFVARLGRAEAWVMLLAFNIFPSAFYVVTPYSEAATLALILASYVCMARDRWILAGLAVGAATALRISAGAFSLALGCAALLAARRKRREGDKGWWRPLVAIPLSGWGQLATLLMLKIFVGDAMAYFRARTALNDNREFGRIIDPEWYLQGFGAQHMDSVMLVGCIAIVALVGREVAKRFPREEAIFLIVGSLVTAVLSIAALQHWWSLNRYLLLCPFVFVCLAQVARKHGAVFVLWCVLCAAIYWHVELCSYITQGHPHMCPCLGEVEFAMPWGS